MKQPTIIVPDGLQRVLLHACCAPCSSAIVEWLCAHDIEPIIFYYNPNIYPQEEYEIRKSESKRHAESLGIQWIDGDVGCQMLDAGCQMLDVGCQMLDVGCQMSDVGCQMSDVGCQMSVVSSQWSGSHAEWLEAMRGLENEPERGSRCAQCFYYRMLATARAAQALGIQWFATTLASSRWKNLEQINAAGERAAEDVGCKISDGGCKMLDGGEPPQASRIDVRFWAQNWRKDGLQERRNQLLKEYNFYNQQYCGCEFSKKYKT